MSGAPGTSSSGRPLRTQPAASSASLKKKGMSVSDLSVSRKYRKWEVLTTADPTCS